jgi:acyl carrier protein
VHGLLEQMREEVERGARHLVLVGRRAPGESVQQRIAGLERAGAEVVTRQVDVSDAGAVRAMLSEIRGSLPRLRGIIHAAGVLDDGILLQQTWPRFAAVLAPKVAVVWNLHCAMKDLPLDFFVSFSSIASLLGSPGQANHAAANAFLDAMSFFRRSQGLAGLTIGWGPWSEVGVVAERGIDHRPDRTAIGSIRPQHGIQLMQRMLHADIAYVAVSPIDWQSLRSQIGDLPMLAELRGSEFEPRATGSALRARLESAVFEDRSALLAAHVSSEVARVLGLLPSQPIPQGRGFFELGLDSLTSIELRNRLQDSLGCTLPSTIAFDFPTVEAMAGYLRQRVLPPLFPWQPQAGRPAPAMSRLADADDLDKLSDEMAETLLIRKLESLHY